jgi:hypothetical protein
MIITNFEGLPQPLVDAVTKDPYRAPNCDFTVTQLIAPPRKVALEKQNDSIMEVDASERLWALLGQIGHGILERSANAGIIEKRWYEAIDGFVISGQSDLVLTENKLIDYKFCSVWTVKEGLKKEWEEQMNLLAFLAESKAQPIKEAQIICIFRDWSIMEARRDRNYPQRQVQVLPVPLWGYDRSMAFCRERIKLHADAQSGMSPLPECTPEERWEKAPKWAVMKKGRMRAVKLYDNEKDAVKHSLAEKNTAVVHRPGESVRCANYCAAAPFCEQWKKISGAFISSEAQAEDSGAGADLGEPVGLVQEKVTTLPPPPIQQQRSLDEFPVEPDVARKAPVQPGQFAVEPDAAKSIGAVTRAAVAPVTPQAKGKGTIVPAVVDFRSQPDDEPLPEPALQPTPVTDPALHGVVPKPFVGREKPVKIEEPPVPPMPEVP